MTGKTLIERDTPRTIGDDLDDAIYHHRVVEHQSWREVAANTGTTHETARRRFTQLMRTLAHGDIEEMRTEEGHRLDTLASQNRRLVELALGTEALAAARATADPEAIMLAAASVDIDAAQRGLREIHALARTRHQLFGITIDPNTNPPDDESLIDLLGAYLKGHQDAQDVTG